MANSIHAPSISDVRPRGGRGLRCRVLAVRPNQGPIGLHAWPTEREPVSGPSLHLLEGLLHVVGSISVSARYRMLLHLSGLAGRCRRPRGRAVLHRARGRGILRTYREHATGSPINAVRDRAGEAVEATVGPTPTTQPGRTKPPGASTRARSCRSSGLPRLGRSGLRRSLPGLVDGDQRVSAPGGRCLRHRQEPRPASSIWRFADITVRGPNDAHSVELPHCTHLHCAKSVILPSVP